MSKLLHPSPSGLRSSCQRHLCARKATDRSEMDQWLKMPEHQTEPPAGTTILLQPSCVAAPAFWDYVRSRSSRALAAFRSALSNTTVNLL